MHKNGAAGQERAKKESVQEGDTRVRTRSPQEITNKERLRFEFEKSMKSKENKNKNSQQ